ncbi:MAG: Fe-S cluster assembly ATPase SufC [Flavobacteriales bacterium]|nr:Fe-S cluster assembly ATPase SufC [Flavobacteriales bacterium]
MLKIENLQCSINANPVLKGLNLSVKPGEVHAIMGPNGSGKSTLASVIAGNDNYDVDGGDINFDNQSILEISPEERARMGIFMSFQYPVEIPGVSVSNFIKTAVTAMRKFRGEKPLSSSDLLKAMKENMDLLKMDSGFLSRSMNEGFSGGEKKRNEIFQLAMLNPRLSILDETDSGLDIDALKIVANGVNRLRSAENSFIIITHYQRLLDYISPDHVHILSDGKIVSSGSAELALKLEKEGYDEITK